MQRRLAPVAVGLALLAGPAAADDLPPAPFAVGVLERDLIQLLEWLEGEWDNAEQVGFATELGYPETATPERLHVTIRRIEAPALGPLVLRLDQYRDNDPANPGRQRLYALTVDSAEMAIRMDVLAPEGSARLGRDADHSTLTRDDLRFNEGCQIYWRRTADQFVGWIRDAACRIRSEGGSGPMLTVSADMHLSMDQLWMAESVRDDRGRNPFPRDLGIPTQYRRATTFTCWMAVPRQAPQEGWFYARDLVLHDQGGEVWVSTDETTPRSFGFRLRNVRWPSGPNADALTLYVHSERDGPAISYAWASPDATRIGINLRTLQGSCSR